MHCGSEKHSLEQHRFTGTRADPEHCRRLQQQIDMIIGNIGIRSGTGKAAKLCLQAMR